WARSTSARISFTPTVSPSGTTNRTSAWVPASVVWQAGQGPQAWSAHCRAAAEGRAAVRPPGPGGPVDHQAARTPRPRPPPAGPRRGPPPRAGPRGGSRPARPGLGGPRKPRNPSGLGLRVGGGQRAGEGGGGRSLGDVRFGRGRPAVAGRWLRRR